MVLLVGGFLITLIVMGNPNWFLFVPWKRTADPTSLIGLSITLSGFVLAFRGAAYIIFASADRSWCLNSLKDTLEHTPEKEEEISKRRLQDLKGNIKSLRDSAEKG